MNAQQLIQETPIEKSFDYSVFFKSNQSQQKKAVGRMTHLKETADTSQSPNKLQSVSTRGDKFVEQDFDVPNVKCQTPRTLNYTKIKQQEIDAKWQQAEKELNLIQL